MPPFLDAMKKYGPVTILPATWRLTAQNLVRRLCGCSRRRNRVFERTGTMLYPYHGVLVAAPTLDDAYDLLERIEYNAAAILFSRLIEG